MSEEASFWAVLPAAGAGRRFGGTLPKQYMDLGGRPLIEYSLELFLEHPRIRGVVVALDPADPHWEGTAFAQDSRVIRVAGGAERCNSVLNALDGLAETAGEADWVLVHDAARPCLRREDLDRVLNLLRMHPVGGLLGVPVRDTMKQVGEGGAVRRTVPREGLWHAFTPQMFRLRVLRRALRQAMAGGWMVTDEASAVELFGLEPMMVQGHTDNIKVTNREDLPLAGFHLQQQGRLC